MKNIGIFLIFIIGCFAVLYFFKHVISLAEPNSMFVKIKNVNFSLFIQTFCGCMLAFAAYIATVPNVIHMINPNADNHIIKKFVFSSSKIFLAFIFVFSLIVSLDENQFTVITSVISFFALFSFVFPKRINQGLKDIFKELRNSDNKNGNQEE